MGDAKSIDKSSKERPRMSANNKLGTDISFILIREHKYERQCSLIKMWGEIILMCLIILTLTGEFILWASQI